MIQTTASAGAPASSTFWRTPDVTEFYTDGANYYAVQNSDLIGAPVSAVANSPKKTVKSVFSGSIAIPARAMGLHVARYVTGAQTTPQPTIPIGLLRTHDCGCHWAQIETSAGVYNWANLDALVTYAESIGADVCHTLVYTPSFHAADTTKLDQYARPGGSSMPTSTATWAAYVTACTMRYGARIKYWEIWNEPNYKSSSTVGTFFGTAANMVTLCQLAYGVIKNLATNTGALSAVVISPACFGETVNGISPAGSTWLNDFLVAGGAPYFDWVGYHFYLAFNRDSAYLTTYWSAIKAVMTANGIGSRNLCCTEVGNQEVYTVNNQKVMDEDTRARWLARILLRLMVLGSPWVGWYMYDGNVYDAEGRSHGMISGGVETVQCDAWRLVAPFAGKTVTALNEHLDGRIGVLTSDGASLII